MSEQIQIHITCSPVLVSVVCIMPLPKNRSGGGIGGRGGRPQRKKTFKNQRERRAEYQKTRERRRQRKHHLYEIRPRVRRDRVRLLRFYLPERGEKEETGGRTGPTEIALETDVNHGTRRLPNGLSLRLQERYQRRLERRSVIQTTLLLRPQQVRIRKRSRSSDIRRKRGKRDRQCSDSD